MGEAVENGVEKTLDGFRTQGKDVIVRFVWTPGFRWRLGLKWLRNSCQDTDGMWSFLAETAHVGEWDRTSSTKS